MMTLIGLILLTAAPPELHAQAAIAVDLDSNEVLFQKGDGGPRAIASMTKLMAMQAVWRRHLDLDAETTMARSDYEYTKTGSRSRLMTGHPYRNRDLLHAALLGSDNRAVMALGRAVGLEHDALVLAMNREAKRLGLLDMAFFDPTGIDHRNVARPIEVVALLRATLAVPALAAVARTAVWDADARERNGRPLQYHSTNLLVNDPGREVLAGKTGFNSAAGWCLAVAVRLKSGRRVGVVVMGAPEKFLRFRDARRVIRYVRAMPWSAPERSGAGKGARAR